AARCTARDGRHNFPYSRSLFARRHHALRPEAHSAGPHLSVSRRALRNTHRRNGLLFISTTLSRRRIRALPRRQFLQRPTLGARNFPNPCPHFRVAPSGPRRDWWNDSLPCRISGAPQRRDPAPHRIRIVFNRRFQHWARGGPHRHGPHRRLCRTRDVPAALRRAPHPALVAHGFRVADFCFGLRHRSARLVGCGHRPHSIVVLIQGGKSAFVIRHFDSVVSSGHASCHRSGSRGRHYHHRYEAARNRQGWPHRHTLGTRPHLHYFCRRNDDYPLSSDYPAARWSVYGTDCRGNVDSSRSLESNRNTTMVTRRPRPEPTAPRDRQGALRISSKVGNPNSETPLNRNIQGLGPLQRLAPTRYRYRSWPRRLSSCGSASCDHDPQFMVGHRLSSSVRYRNHRRNDVDHRAAGNAFRLHRRSIFWLEPRHGHRLRLVEPGIRFVPLLSNWFRRRLVQFSPTLDSSLIGIAHPGQLPFQCTAVPLAECCRNF